MRSPVSVLKRVAVRRARGLLVRRARARPSAADEAGAERRVFIVLMNAFGMGGIVRTTWNLAGHLAAGKLKYRESVVNGLDNAPRGLIALLRGEHFGKQLVKLD